MLDTFGDKRKEIERLECDRKFLPLVPIIVRLDGKTFHNYCKDFNKPFDARFTNAMIDTVKKLVEITNAKIGYIQSDEITLLYYSDSYECQIYFDGNIQKMVSVIGSLCTAYFNNIIVNHIPLEELKSLAYFDCRAFSVGSKQEALNQFIFRQDDASKNSTSMMARAYFKHNELQDKNRSEMQEMMFSEYGINWNDYPYQFKHGSFIQKKKIIKNFSIDEINLLPEKHAARINPSLRFERSVIEVYDYPLRKIINAIDVLFDAKFPLMTFDIVEDI